MKITRIIENKKVLNPEESEGCLVMALLPVILLTLKEYSWKARGLHIIQWARRA